MKLPPVFTPPAEDLKFTFGPFRLEADGSLWRRDLPIHLPPKELAALRLLLAHAGQVVSAAQLKQLLWSDVHVTDDSVPRCLSSLRAKLEPDDCIQTIYKRGYRLSGAVQQHRTAPAPRLPRLAIVPFTRDSEVYESMGRIVAEETAARLTALGSSFVSIIAWDSVLTLLARGLSAHEMGKQLDADLVLTGTLRSTTTHFRLRVEMIRVQDAAQIWVEDILVPREFAPAVQNELVQRLVFRLRSKEADASQALPVTQLDPQPDARAYEVFLRARADWQSLERHRMEDAMQLLWQVAEMDRSFIPARIDTVHLALVQCSLGFVSPAVAAAHVRNAVESIPDIRRSALSLLPCLGWLSFFFDRDLPAALQWFAQSQDLPHSPWTTRARSMFAASRGRLNQAIQIDSDALRVDPFAPALHSRLAWFHHLAGEREKSVEAVERCLSICPENSPIRICGAIIFAYNNQTDRADALVQKVLEKTPHQDLASACYAYVLARAGRHDQAHEILQQMEWLSRERFVLTSFTAAAYLELGNPEAAIRELQVANEARCPWIFQVLADPRLDPLRGHPDFDSLQQASRSMEATAEEAVGAV